MGGISVYRIIYGCIHSSWKVDGTQSPTYWFMYKDPLHPLTFCYRQAIYFDLKVYYTYIHTYLFPP